jgi:chromosome segregation ATPase
MSALAGQVLDYFVWAVELAAAAMLLLATLHVVLDIRRSNKRLAQLRVERDDAKKALDESQRELDEAQKAVDESRVDADVAMKEFIAYQEEQLARRLVAYELSHIDSFRRVRGGRA